MLLILFGILFRDHGDLSPNTIENESCKSNDAELDYPRKRRNSSLNKVPLYSEDGK
jgi:hypothetical protein